MVVTTTPISVRRRAKVTGPTRKSHPAGQKTRRKNPDKTAPPRCSTTLDIRCNSEGEIPLALPLPEVKPRFPLPLSLMHFHFVLLMYFRSGGDTLSTYMLDTPAGHTIGGFEG